MNESDSSNKEVKKYLENSSGSTQNYSSIDYVNLKLAMKPADYYKLVKCKKTKMHDYNYIVDKVRNLSPPYKNSSIILYIKVSAKEEVKISSEDDWKNYFEANGKTVLELLDSKNTLKIEFEYSALLSEENNDKASERLKFLLFEKDSLGLDILRTIFSITTKNDLIKNKIREVVLKTSLKNESGVSEAVQSKKFDEYLQKYFEKTTEKLKRLSSLKNDLMSTAADTSDIFFDNDNSTDEDPILPSFSEFFKNEEIEMFRTKIMSETFFSGGDNFK